MFCLSDPERFSKASGPKNIDIHTILSLLLWTKWNSKETNKQKESTDWDKWTPNIQQRIYRVYPMCPEGHMRRSAQVGLTAHFGVWQLCRETQKRSARPSTDSAMTLNITYPDTLILGFRVIIWEQKHTKIFVISKPIWVNYKSQGRSEKGEERCYTPSPVSELIKE